MKYCKDCRYLTGFDRFCKANGARPKSPVTGERVVVFAAAARSEQGDCGPDAELFQPKKHFDASKLFFG
jgi:hypothetical protein